MNQPKNHFQRLREIHDELHHVSYRNHIDDFLETYEEKDNINDLEWVKKRILSFQLQSMNDAKQGKSKTYFSFNEIYPDLISLSATVSDLKAIYAYIESQGFSISTEFKPSKVLVSPEEEALLFMATISWA